uniref:Uncharacterized protein n=1 Tax=Rhizophora mucronata TaxID=61149 RepID=A0A2P2NM03_RHIMU
MGFNTFQFILIFNQVKQSDI